MKQTICILSALMLLAVSAFQAQQVPTPAPAQTRSILILNATAHIGNGQVMENCALGFRDGKIDMVADARLIRLSSGAYDTTIYADGMHVYPGFIATNSTLGLLEIDAARPTNDMAETGTFKPSMRAAIAYNTDSEIIPTVRSNGVLMAQITPRGGIISGTSSVMQLDAWNWEDALIREDDGLHLNWPQVYHKHNDKGKVSIEKVKTYDQQLREIELFFSEAKAYCNDAEPALKEVRYEALRGVLEGKQTLYVHAQDVKSMTEAIHFKKEHSIAKMVIVGGYDAWMIPDMLKENDVAVMIRKIHEVPLRKDEDVDLPFKIPSLLYKAGIKFCIQNECEMERTDLRNLPFQAGTAVAHGLPYEEAVRALTLTPAQILGIDATCGTLEPGKDATLFISKGDALDMTTNAVLHAFIQGRDIDLSSKQTELYEKYKKKYDEKK